MEQRIYTNNLLQRQSNQNAQKYCGTVANKEKQIYQKQQPQKPNQQHCGSSSCFAVSGASTEHPDTKPSHKPSDGYDKYRF